jgi:biopolymer transport protein ExbB
MFWNQSITTLFSKVGLTAWPLFFCSVIALAIIAERSFYFYRLKLNYSKFSQKLFELLRQNKIKQALLFCRKHPNPVVRIAFLYLKNINSELRDSILSREGSLAMEQVENRLRGLSAITHIAPLLGLLGTVTGLVTAFHKIELLGGQVHAENLAGGIWEALLSTVFGLIVAIPCMAAYHAFESGADRIARRIQTIVSELDELFEKKEVNRNIFKQAFEIDDEIIKGAE